MGRRLFYAVAQDVCSGNDPRAVRALQALSVYLRRSNLAADTFAFFPVTQQLARRNDPHVFVRHHRRRLLVLPWCVSSLFFSPPFRAHCCLHASTGVTDLTGLTC